MKLFLYNYSNVITTTNVESKYVNAIQNFTYECPTAELSLIKSTPDDIYDFFAIDNSTLKDSYVTDIQANRSKAGVCYQ